MTERVANQRMSDTSLHGRTVLITGGGSGIGRSIALAFGQAGARVAILGRNEGRLETVKKELISEGTQALAVQGDVAVSAEVVSAVRSTEATFGHIDVLVTAAGVLSKGPLAQVTDLDISSTFQTNVFGTIYTCRAVVPGMSDRGFGRVITISSVLGLVGITHRSVYAASKAAIISFSKSLAGEFAERGVTINSIAPGPILKDDTSMSQSAPAIEDDPAPSRMIDHEVFVHRWGVPADIARAALLLASDPTGFINGTVITVDGGYTAH